MKQPLLHLAAALLLCLPASLARAEGSKQLTPNTNPTVALTNAANTRAGYLTHDFNNIVSGQYQSQGFLKPATWSGGTGRPFSTDYRLRVRLKPGETLFYGVHRIASENGSGNQNNLILTLKYDNNGTETQAATNTLPFSTAAGNTRRSLLAAGPGVIDNAAQAQAGPAVAGTASASTGYNPLTYTNNTNAERDFWVELTQTGEAAMSQTQKISQYDFWDFTVRSSADASGQEIPGRLHSKFWSFTTAGFTNRLSATFSLYPLVPSVRQPGRYYVKEVELAGMNPYAFYFVSNAKGTDRNSTDFLTSRRSQTSEQTYPEYFNFVNDPDPSIWPSAPLPVFSRTVQPFCNPITGRGAAAFTTTSEEAGSTSVLIDINNNGVQDGNDVVIEQNVAASVPTTTFWNGLDNASQPVPAGTALRLTFISNGAPVNFPLFDVEGNTDGLRVQNVRPSQGDNRFFDRLYWDDRNLPTTTARFPATRPAPDLSNYRPDGVISEEGVHRWTGTAGSQGGDNYTVNTWTYGFISAAAEQRYTFDFKCDFDGDGVADKDDIDDDNDGIPDVVEMFALNPQTATSNGVATTTGNGVLVYLDAAYVHPVLGAYRDLNRDGINDIFDADGDGLPNHLDLDSDGDGLPDAFEASGNINPTWTLGSGATQSRYNATQARFTGAVGANGLPDAAEARTAGGPEVNVTRHSLPDRDADSRTASGITASNYNFLDFDSDNDGISDEIEAQSTSAYIARRSQANFTTDTNGNGLRDAYEGAGAISSVMNLDGDAQADMFDFDSDNDNAGKGSLPIAEQTADWTEGFDDNQDGFAGNEVVAKARAFALANPSKASYYVVTTNSQGERAILFSTFLKDDDSNGIPNFLQIGHPTYHDDNFNGLVDLFDPAYGGTPSTLPLVGGAGTEAIFRSGAIAVPLPVTLVDFRAQAVGRDALVSWTTVQEVNSASFVVERSNDGSSFVPVATLPARGTSNQRLNYRITDKNAGAQAGLRYYRLLQLDLDGTVARSDVKTVRFDGRSSDTAVRLFPNPTSANVTLDLAQLPTGAYRVEVLGAEGRKVAEWSASGGQEQVLPTQNLAKGVYLLRISGHNTTQVIKLVKN
ncbi:T9SS type A sorting domain-containing protein [Hymenobacter sp. ISL-91]|uniref:T9SS type A sorting domain-containing protein n=1 Tax=Hymenobacter sp. ISL-91 TaxID=2819151 RepID=UPI001BE7A103|nr:T9SS type A sorting domain-containing protein [Hymenobacter sp. ISL-91]MBT2559140.1 T9SS type A sorting domain-containing protein [Hymenobacter sp. ISL-91]